MRSLSHGQYAQYSEGCISILQMSKLSLRELEIIYKVTWLFNVSQILNSYVTILSSELFAAFNDYS